MSGAESPTFKTEKEIDRFGGTPELIGSTSSSLFFNLDFAFIFDAVETLFAFDILLNFQRLLSGISGLTRMRTIVNSSFSKNIDVTKNGVMLNFSTGFVNDNKNSVYPEGFRWTLNKDRMLN